MELEFDDFTSALRTPPKLSDLMLEKKDSRRKNNDLLIIVPSYHDHFRLNKLLRYLRMQTFQNFDVAIIFATDDDFIDAQGLPICQIKRKADYGFAGSVYTGQLFALTEGYKYYLFTDVDRVPHTPDSLGILYRTAEKENADFVFGNNLVKGYFFQSAGFFDFKNPQAVKSNCVFGVIRTSTLERTGLYALPLYIGYEDVEFEYRLLKCSRKTVYLPQTIFESYNSPAKAPFLNNFGKEKSGHMYVYPTITCIYNCPQTAIHLGIARAARIFFIMLLTQKLSALRIPELSQFEKNARACMLAKTRGSGTLQDVSRQQTSNSMPQDYQNYTSNAPFSNLSRILRATLLHSKNYPTSNYSPLFDFFLHDSFFVYDEQAGKTLLFEWKRKPGAFSKTLALLSALLDSSIALLKALFFDATGNLGTFQKYGVQPKQE